MATSKNIVVAGDYIGKFIVSTSGKLFISTGFLSTIELNKSSIAAYELVTDEHQKSAASGITRGIVGGILLGPVGMLAGAVTAKNAGLYQVAIQFHDGKKSLVSLDTKNCNLLLKKCF